MSNIKKRTRPDPGILPEYVKDETPYGVDSMVNKIADWCVEKANSDHTDLEAMRHMIQARLLREVARTMEALPRDVRMLHWILKQTPAQSTKDVFDEPLPPAQEG